MTTEIRTNFTNPSEVRQYATQQLQSLAKMQTQILGTDDLQNYYVLKHGTAINAKFKEIRQSIFKIAESEFVENSECQTAFVHLKDGYEIVQQNYQSELTEMAKCLMKEVDEHISAIEGPIEAIRENRFDYLQQLTDLETYTYPLTDCPFSSVKINAETILEKITTARQKLKDRLQAEREISPSSSDTCSSSSSVEKRLKLGVPLIGLPTTQFGNLNTLRKTIKASETSMSSTGLSPSILSPSRLNDTHLCSFSASSSPFATASGMPNYDQVHISYGPTPLNPTLLNKIQEQLKQAEVACSIEEGSAEDWDDEPIHTSSSSSSSSSSSGSAVFSSMPRDFSSTTLQQVLASQSHRQPIYASSSSSPISSTTPCAPISSVKMLDSTMKCDSPLDAQIMLKYFQFQLVQTSDLDKIAQSLNALNLEVLFNILNMKMPIGERVYFHLYMILNNDNPKLIREGDPEYIQKAFLNKDGCKATREQRNQALIRTRMELLLDGLEKAAQDKSQQLINVYVSEWRLINLEMGKDLEINELISPEMVIKLVASIRNALITQWKI